MFYGPPGHCSLWTSCLCPINIPSRWRAVIPINGDVQMLAAKTKTHTHERERTPASAHTIIHTIIGFQNPQALIQPHCDTQLRFHKQNAHIAYSSFPPSYKIHDIMQLQKSNFHNVAPSCGFLRKLTNSR